MGKQETDYYLQHLPFLTASEFNIACDELLLKSQHVVSDTNMIINSVEGNDDTRYLKILRQIAIDPQQRIQMQSVITNAEQKEDLFEDIVDDDDDDEVSQPNDVTEDIAHRDRRPFSNVEEPYRPSQ